MTKRKWLSGRTITIALLVLFVLLAFLQYRSFTITQKVLIENTQLEQLRTEFKFVPPKNITKEAALEALLTAEEEIIELEEEGIPTLFFKDTLLLAQRHFIGDNLASLSDDIATREEGLKRQYLQNLYDLGVTARDADRKPQDYTEVLRLTQLITFKRDQAFTVLDALALFTEKEREYEQIGLDTTRAATLYRDAQQSFTGERYSEAANLLLQANEELDQKRKEQERGKGIVALSKSYIVTHWPQVIVAIIIIIIITPFAFRGLRRSAAQRKLADVKREIETTTELIKEAQIECFKKRLITVDTYRTMEEKYKAKIAELKRKIPVLEAIARGEKAPKEEKKEKIRKGILQIEDEE